ncbi:pancreatic polypeptide [Erinaceus europaeus]|nr:pancreatic polypeptide [Erinaceus europaeus]
MVAVGRCLSLLLLSTCVALLLQPPLGAHGVPLEPVYPGDNATPEQMAHYAAELRRYINMLTRPRYGKRDKGGTVDFLEWGPPRTAGPRELGPMDF